MELLFGDLRDKSICPKLVYSSGRTGCSHRSMFGRDFKSKFLQHTIISRPYKMIGSLTLLITLPASTYITEEAAVAITLFRLLACTHGPLGGSVVRNQLPMQEMQPGDMGSISWV